MNCILNCFYQKGLYKKELFKKYFFLESIQTATRHSSVYVRLGRIIVDGVQWEGWSPNYLPDSICEWSLMTSVEEIRPRITSFGNTWREELLQVILYSLLYSSSFTQNYWTLSLSFFSLIADECKQEGNKTCKNWRAKGEEDEDSVYVVRLKSAYIHGKDKIDCFNTLFLHIVQWYVI